MPIFCPTCGLENQPDRNFCRGCGVNLRVVQTALEMGPQVESTLMTKKHAVDMVLRKISELQLKKADDLRKIIEQVEKLTESDDVRRVRHLRNAVITIAIVSGAICLFSLGMLADQRATGPMMGVIAIFLAVVVPALLFMLYRLGQPLRQQGPPETKLPMTSGAQTGSPPLARQMPMSVTEQTTQQLDAVYRPPKSEVNQPE
jgi:hypothetical protein